MSQEIEKLLFSQTELLAQVVWSAADITPWWVRYEPFLWLHEHFALLQQLSTVWLKLEFKTTYIAGYTELSFWKESIHPTCKVPYSLVWKLWQGCDLVDLNKDKILTPLSSLGSFILHSCLGVKLDDQALKLASLLFTAWHGYFRAFGLLDTKCSFLV